ncbi:unnamed protein product [Schistosoma mattheei]|uniref:Uncharacterized protein n=1 Tax=Schistosoma mattheei TaxID=31246 RepID=A0A183PLA0_9TREM|nr:unnamed protein product [Schistosoma mattheei]
MLIDWIMKTSTSEWKQGIQQKSRMQLDDLDFADDLALLPQPQQQMQEKTTNVAAASAAIGLNIHKGKSKIIRYNTECNNPITLNREDLEDVKTFTYLSSMIDEHGGSDVDVKELIGKKYTIVYSARFIQSGPYQRSLHFTRANEQIELIKQGSLSLMHKTQEFLSL